MGVLVGEFLLEAEGVPPLDMGLKSETGPSYIPRGTALNTAICKTEQALSCSPKKVFSKMWLNILLGN